MRPRWALLAVALAAYAAPTSRGLDVSADQQSADRDQDLDAFPGGEWNQSTGTAPEVPVGVGLRRQAAAATSRRLAVCSGSFVLDSDLAAGTAGVVRAMEYIPGAELLVVGGEDQVLRIWELSPFSATVFQELTGHNEAIWALEWIGDHGLLASGSGDGTIRFWPTAVLSATQTCSAVASCCDGSGLGCEGQYVVSWRDVPMAKRRQVHSLLWISSEGVLLSGWADRKIRKWTYSGDGTNPSWTYTGELESADRVFDMVYLTGNSYLATVSPDSKFPRLWDDLTVPTVNFLTLDIGIGATGFGLCPWGHCDAVLALDHDGTGSASEMLATGSMDGTVIIWDAANMNRLGKFEGHTDYVASVVWMASEDQVASGSKDGDIRIWDSVSGSIVDQTSSSETLTGHTDQVNALVWMDGVSQGQLASGGSDGNVKLWTCTR